ncbi:MAG: hypothetical protein RMJ56_01330 [Gemmataceae bacterium]|nr:hypothetical protein [Gemmata sp.]MDW8196223.1 hypothetical protein [Gemmataceae bacterium]
MWYRVFSLSAQEPPPAQLAEYLHARGLMIEPHFRGDDLGWTEGELRLPTGSPVLLARYLTNDDDLRDDLNAYAAELETLTYSPHSLPLMTRVIQTQQLFTLRQPVDIRDEVFVTTLLEEACRFLASTTDGVYQIDGRGWFAATGEVLVPEY